MKKTEIQKLSKKTTVDLQKDLGVSREELRALKFELAAGKVKNIRKVKDAKKTIARILTLMNNPKGK
mgnify:CR=1 FL=1